MKLDFSAARAGQAGCPSERTLDALHLGALPEDERAAAAAHVAGCGDCAARLVEIQQGFQAFAGLDERAVLARIQTRHAEAQARRPWWRFAWLALPVGAAAALAVFALRPGPVDPVEPPGVRAKGGAVLRVMRQRGEAPAEEILSGAACQAGDRLRFVVDLPAAGAVRIVARGEGDALVPVWPAVGAEAMGPGRGQVVPGAVALDDAGGDERLFLIHCAGAEPACTLAGDALTCPSGCTSSAFVVRRDPAP